MRFDITTTVRRLLALVGLGRDVDSIVGTINAAVRRLEKFTQAELARMSDRESAIQALEDAQDRSDAELNRAFRVIHKLDSLTS